MTYNLTKPNRTAIGVPDLVSSSRDFGVEQFFRADDFRADDPSPAGFDLTAEKVLNFWGKQSNFGNFKQNVRI